MLVWLASYPRSGNTLLRQVLKACFDLSSCEGLERVPANFREPDGIRDEFYGSYFVEGDPEEFYARARSSSDLVLIKSHQLPRDSEKAIYVVRDGRLALKSFVRFQDNNHPGSASFESLLLGDHPYGDWASHYRTWCDARQGETLILRFEELVNADAALLARIAAFLGLPGAKRPWVNPQAQLRELAPAFFGTGTRTWCADPFWTETRLRQFYTLHGSLLAQLGYASTAEVEAGAYPIDSDEAHLLRFTHKLAARRNTLQTVCDERDQLLSRMKRECEGELTTLANACAERDELLKKIDAQRKEQARSANRQLAAADDRLRELEQHALNLERKLWWRRLPLFAQLRRLLRR